MAIILQDFIQWSPNQNKNVGNYVKPTSKALFNVVSLNLIELSEQNLWNNLKNGDKVFFTTDDVLPTSLIGEYYVRKSVSPRISLHSTRENAINNILPFNFSDNGRGNNYININFDFILKCTFKGETGNFEPVWNRNINTLVLDGTCEWKILNPLYVELNALEMLPEARQKEDAFIKISDLLNHQIAVIDQELKPMVGKYTDYNKLDDKHLYLLLKEFGYEYLADASILDTSKLSTLISYLKLIHFLKGTRKGLQLVLDLLGYDYTDTLWYEKSPKGEPHTFDLDITVPITAVNNTTIGNLNTFLRNYVYPLSTLVIDILPFKLLQTYSGGGGFSDQIYEFDMNFEIPLLGNLDLFNYPYRDGQGLKVTDDSDNANDSFIIQTENDPTATFRYLYSPDSTPIQDLSVNNNDANIINSVIDRGDLFEYEYTDGSGLIISDSSVRNNDSNIISSNTDKRLFDYKYTENTGLIIGDDSLLNNDSNIVSSNIIKEVFNYQYTNGIGLTVTNNLGNAPDSAIILTGDIPQPENLRAWYKLNTDALDYSGNNFNATVFGGSFVGNRLDLGINDYLSIPHSVLNGVTNFTYCGWFDLNAINIDFHSLLSIAISAQPKVLSFVYDPLAKGFRGLFFNQFFSFSINAVSGTYNGQSDFETGEHHVAIARNNNIITLYIDGELRAVADFYPGAISTEINGLIVGQDQDSVGGGFDPNQSLNSKVDNLFFYDIELKQSEIIKLYNKAR